MNPFVNPMSRRTMMAVTAGSLTAATAAKTQVGSGGIDLSTPSPIGNPASLSLVTSAGSPDATQTTIALSTTWKFREDPTNTGLTSAWYSTGFNDSGWGTLLSGHTWESQSPGNYSGYAWYRQDAIAPPVLGQWLVLTLSPIAGDDLTYWNGNLIGGISGNTKYANVVNRTYYIPPSMVQQSNTIAVRCWGSATGGLIAGTYTIAAYAGQLWMRPAGGTLAQEIPAGAYDLSSAQNGTPFDLVVRPGTSTGTLSYSVLNVYDGTTLGTGTTTITTHQDGINRAICHIDLNLAVQVYCSGNIDVKWTVTGSPVVAKSTATNIQFAARDNIQLPALPVQHDVTPFGNLLLVDKIDCSTPITSEPHPYLQGGLEPYQAASGHTPGPVASVVVSTILGQKARHVDYGFFAYRVGAGGLTPGKQYLLTVTYPEDIPRYVELEVQAGQGYFDVGWKNGLAGNIYDPWPLSGAWQTFYQVFTLGTQTTGTGGAEAGDARNGVWVYFLGVVNGASAINQFWGNYSGGPAIGEIKLYEIDSVANAPSITFPASLPRRLLTFDWERAPAQPPQDLCGYAKLMGYNAISPLVGAKWGTNHYGEPLAGYNTCGEDPQNWPTFVPYVRGSGIPPATSFPLTPSFHKQFLDATAAAGLDYYPRFEYGGSYDLPSAAFSINAAGVPSKPDRYAARGPVTANLLHPAVVAEMVALFDNMVKPYVGFHNFKGLLWRQRKDTMPISYGASDIAMFTADTGNAPPPGLTAAKLAAWASTGAVQPLYATWWHQKRAEFHYSIFNLLKSYRSDIILMYYNWDTDKFGILKPDQNDYLGGYLILEQHGASYYFSTDQTARLSFTPTDYTTALHDGNFAPSNLGVTRPDALWPDYGIRPELYTKPGVKVFCPLNSNCYASQQYIQYFQTAEGVAVSHAVAYDEIGARGINPKYEGTMVIPGGGAFSMTLEVLSWAYCDVNTLTYTTYTFGRGFADYHRAFAQAFLALPAISGTVVNGTASNIVVRTYVSGPSTYIGVAYTGLTSQTLNLNIAGSWPPVVAITNLVTNLVAIAAGGSSLSLCISSGPMELHSFLVVESSSTPSSPGIGQAAPG